MKQIMLPAFTATVIVLLTTISFAYNSSVLDPKAREELDELVSQLNAIPNYRIHLSGHTDNTGSDEHNTRLSEARALAVKNYLFSKHVDSTRISVDFYGESAPAAPNTTVENMALNRRVEVTVTGEQILPPEAEISIPEPEQSKQIEVASQEEETVVPAKPAIKKKKVRRRLVWTGWKTGFHWSTAGR